MRHLTTILLTGALLCAPLGLARRVAGPHVGPPPWDRPGYYRHMPIAAPGWTNLGPLRPGTW